MNKFKAMDKLKEIRKEADKLEVNITELLTDFIKKNGQCTISLCCEETYFSGANSGEKSMLNVKAKVNVTI
jgi:hypothetical protein